MNHHTNKLHMQLTIQTYQRDAKFNLCFHLIWIMKLYLTTESELSKT